MHSIFREISMQKLSWYYINGVEAEVLILVCEKFHLCI